MATIAPAPATTNPLRRILGDLRAERRAADPLPPGRTRPSIAFTRRFAADPLPILLDGYRRWGPVFTLRVMHMPVVFMLGPAANHYMTVSHAANFAWREGSMGDLIPLLGDGLLTTDGAAHRRARRIVLPTFHHERIAATLDTMIDEVLRVLDAWRPGDRIDLYAATRRLALRIAMRALFGLDPDRDTHGIDAAVEFERGLSFYAEDYFTQALRGPRTPWARMQAARQCIDELIFAEIACRRRDDEPRQDVLSLLLQARDEDGEALSDRQVRDQVMTLLFAGHDTTTSTVSFLFHELARDAEAMRRVLDEQDRLLGGRTPTAAELMGEGLPELEMALDETLRLYPPAWVGPRLSLDAFELEGVTVPGRTHVNYCSWASHRLPDVFDEPDAFRPERFARAAKAALPKGAYVPFGGGSRTCIGMRFGQLEIRTIATLVLQRFGVALEPGYELGIRQMPTLSPREGLPVRLGERGVASAA